MSKKYTVYISEVSYGTIEVIAENEKEAKKKAEDSWFHKKSDINWNSTELTDVQPEEE